MNNDPLLKEEIIKHFGETSYKSGELDRKYMELAPWAPYGTRTLSTFVSDEIDLDKIIYSPTFFEYLTSFELNE